MSDQKQRRIFTSLVLGHLLLSPFWFTDSTDLDSRTAMFMALLFGQGMLLTVWLATDPLHRLKAATVTMVFWAVGTAVNILMQDPSGDVGLILAIVAVMSAAVGIVLYFVLRFANVSLQTTAAIAQTEFTDLRFSIRDLMLATLAVAIIVGMRPYITDSVTFIIVVISLCMFVVPMFSIWACLSASRPTLPVFLVVGLAALIGAIPPLYFEFYREHLWFWPVVFGLQAVVINASLLVIRSCGYRLARHAEVASAEALPNRPAANKND